MPNGTSPQILVDGLHFPEGARWRTTAPGEGKLWFVDILAGKVMAVDTRLYQSTYASNRQAYGTWRDYGQARQLITKYIAF